MAHSSHTRVGKQKPKVRMRLAAVNLISLAEPSPSVLFRMSVGTLLQSSAFASSCPLCGQVAWHASKQLGQHLIYYPFAQACVCTCLQSYSLACALPGVRARM